MRYKINKLSSIDAKKALLGDAKLQYFADDLVPIDSSRDNLIFTTLNHQYIVRISLAKNSQTVIEEVKLMQYLRAQGVAVPKVIRHAKIKIRNTIYPYVIMSYVPHQPVYLAGAVPFEAIIEAAQTLAKLHRAGESYVSDSPSAIFKADLEQDIHDLHRLLTSGKLHAASNCDEVLRDVEWARAFFEIQCAIPTPKTILHNDYRVQNVLFSNNALIAVIDFDYSFVSPHRVKDVTHAALEWSFPEGAPEPNAELYHAFISAYETASDLPLANIREWTMYAALIDAAHYICSYPELQTTLINSYMYDKYRYFRDYSNA